MKNPPKRKPKMLIIFPSKRNETASLCHVVFLIQIWGKGMFIKVKFIWGRKRKYCNMLAYFYIAKGQDHKTSIYIIYFPLFFEVFFLNLEMIWIFHTCSIFSQNVDKKLRLLDSFQFQFLLNFLDPQFKRKFLF